MQVYRSRLTRPSTVAWVLHVGLLGTPVALGDPPGDVATTRNQIAQTNLGTEIIPIAFLTPGVLVIPTGACCHGVGATATAIRVELTSIASPPGPPASGTMVRYVNAVGFNGSNHGEMSINCPDAPADCPNFACAVLGCVPEYRNWAAEVAAIDPANWVIHVTGNAVVPSSTYTVTHVTEGGASSPSAQFTTGLWADVVAGFGTVNVSDLSGVRDWMVELNPAPCKSRTYLRGGFSNHPANPFNHVSVIDVGLVINVLIFNQLYPGLPIAACP